MIHHRVVILVMDSLGIGQAHDVADYNDAGADTLGHIVACAAAGRADSSERQGPLSLPNLHAMGLGAAAALARGTPLSHPLGSESLRAAAYAHAAPASAPKGSTGGHWEMAGLPTIRDWGYLGADASQPYPPALIQDLITACDLPGLIVLGRASGTAVIADHGEAHCRTGQPIVYTSADSVFQIAAHEQTFGLDRLYGVCEIARGLCDHHRIARVIARPFVGENAATFQRSDHRRDYAMPPHGPTLLDGLGAGGIPVITIGKIGDLFAGRGIDISWPVTGLDAVFDCTLACLDGHGEGHSHHADGRGLIFANFCDFDSRYGHRRDVAGYARELARFDRRLPEVLGALRDDDLLIVTADHGNDPTYAGSDHTREYVPVLLAGTGVEPGNYGRRSSFADIGATAARHLGLSADASAGLAGEPIPFPIGPIGDAR